MNKFRLSYRYDDKLIPIELDKVFFLKGLDDTNIETIDKFTTYFENKKEMIDYLIGHNLMPEHCKYLFLTMDTTVEGILYQKPYAYYRTLFFKNDLYKLKGLYVFKYLMEKSTDGNFLEDFIEHYRNIYVHKDFSFFDRIISEIKNYGFQSLDNYSRERFYEEIEKLFNFIFKKTVQNTQVTNYKNVRDFICYLSGEVPIRIRDNSVYKTEDQSKFIIDNNTQKNDVVEEFVKYNKDTKLNMFEAYQDGNDFIAPLSEEIKEESYSEYAQTHYKK